MTGENTWAFTGMEEVINENTRHIASVKEAIEFKSAEDNSLKSPGTDGLTPELYHKFSKSIALFLLSVYKEIINTFVLPHTLCQG